MTETAARSRKEMERDWAAEMRSAEACLETGNRRQAQEHARSATGLAEKLRDPKHLRTTARIWQTLSNQKSAARMRLLAARCERVEDIGAAGPVEPAAFLTNIGFEPRQARNVVFHDLKYEKGRSWLSGIPRKLFIACTSRTGSTLLAASLDRYGLNAQEYFNPERIRQSVKVGEARTLKQYAELIREESFAGGWFATKGAVQSLLFLCYLREFPELAAQWKFVFLTRRNVVRQAVSMEIAERTGQWRSDEPAQAVVKEEHYRFEALLRRYQYVLDANSKWERVFAFLEVEPHRLTFEELIADMYNESVRVAKFMDIDIDAFPEAEKHQPWPKPVATSLNIQWERRFRRDLAAFVRERKEASKA